MLTHKSRAMQQISDENIMLSLREFTFLFIFDLCHFTEKFCEIR